MDVAYFAMPAMTELMLWHASLVNLGYVSYDTEP